MNKINYTNTTLQSQQEDYRDRWPRHETLMLYPSGDNIYYSSNSLQDRVEIIDRNRSNAGDPWKGTFIIIGILSALGLFIYLSNKVISKN